MASFSDAASLFASSFVLSTRDDGSTFYAVKPYAPNWIKSAIYELHDGELPNDSRYALIRAAACALADQLFADADDANEAVYELADDVTPAMTADLLRWYGAHLSRLYVCDEAMEESGADKLGIFDLLSLGYRKAAENVLQILVAEIEDNRAGVFNPDTDCRLLISDNQGIYIPQIYCQQLTQADAEAYGLDWEDVVICQSGPENQLYWDSWTVILDSAEIADQPSTKIPETVWRLHQNGDLWMVRADVELPEDF